MFDASVQSPNGLTPTNLDVRVTARGGAKNKGEVVKFDLTASDAAVSTAVVGATDGIFANVIEAAHPPITGQLHGVCLEDIADDTTGMVRFRGVVQALGGDTSTIGLALTTEATSGELIATTTETDVVLAIALETLADATLGSVLFNGAGFGNV
jgi:hypothetical protein